MLSGILIDMVFILQSRMERWTQVGSYAQRREKIYRSDSDGKHTVEGCR